MNKEIKKIEQALKRQRERTATFVDIEFLIRKQRQYGTLNTRIINNLIN
tara:strand:- start:180 stop:326 length:147 start_codon:yes stop_codon:yes gene_type:complete